MMSTSSRTRSSSGPVLGRSLSPGGRLCSSSPYAPPASFSSGSAFASSTSSSFTASRSAAAFSFHSHQRSASPTRVHLAAISSSSSSPSTSFRLSISDRATSPGRSLSVSSVRKPVGPRAGSQRRSCMCSPTTHPGSFRCALHKNARYHPHGNGGNHSSPSNRLNMRRSAMTNSLVRIGTVEGSDLIKRALATLIRPSSHQQRRRDDFQRRPSRLSCPWPRPTTESRWPSVTQISKQVRKMIRPREKNDSSYHCSLPTSLPPIEDLLCSPQPSFYPSPAVYRRLQILKNSARCPASLPDGGDAVDILLDRIP